MLWIGTDGILCCEWFYADIKWFYAYHVYGFCLDLNATYSYGLWKDHAHANGREVMVRRYLGIPKWELSKGLSNVTPLAQSFGAAWD